MQDNLGFKIKMYIFSLSLLCSLIMIMTFSKAFLEEVNSGSITSDIILLSRVVFFGCLCACLYSLYFFFYIRVQAKDANTEGYVVQSVTDESFSSSVFLSTYVLPFLGFSFDDVSKTVCFVFLFIIIGIILIRLDNYYTNPVLGVFGYKLYKVELMNFHENRVFRTNIITTDKVEKDLEINYKGFSKTFGVAWRSEVQNGENS